MIHFTCDRCKREIDPDLELRYVVRLEVQAMMEPGKKHVLEVMREEERKAERDDSGDPPKP